MRRRLLRVSNLTLISMLIGACVMHPVKDQALREAAISYVESAECQLGSARLEVDSEEMKSTGLTGLMGGVLATALGENRVVAGQNTGLTSRYESENAEQDQGAEERETVDGC